MQVVAAPCIWADAEGDMLDTEAGRGFGCHKVAAGYQQKVRLS